MPTRPARPFAAALALILAFSLTVQAADEKEAKETPPAKPAQPALPTPAELPPKPAAHDTRSMEGWTVRVDRRLIEGPDAAVGAEACSLLAQRLREIAMVVPPESLSRLRKVVIQLDLTHGALRQAQYHGNVVWLRNNGYDEALAKCVHIPDARRFLSRFENHRMPWAVLHELSHAYHDQVLGWDEPRILAAWQKFCDSGRYESVLNINGNHLRHYGLVNHKEFFAEMTETYFGTNDFYPFVAGELKEAEPEIFKLMTEIWGPLPEHEPFLR